MKLYAQHGYAKSDKIDRAFEDGAVNGVIFGPNNEKPESLREYVEKFAQLKPRPDILIDPQLYVSLLTNPKEGNLPLYDYYSSNLTIRDLTPKRINSIVRSVINFQNELPVTRFISP